MSMYEFCDLTPSATTTESLPAEALKYNGEFLDTVIPGFRTLSVSGREVLSKEINLKTLDGFSGGTIINRRVPERKITVNYMLTAQNAYSFREAFNQLNTLLAAEDVQVIFADEPDKYFVGTAYNKEDPEAGRLSVTGELEILCADPYKHSTTEKVFQFTNGVAMVNNSGNVPVPIRYEITHNHENGYIGIASEYGAMEFGKREEADGVTYKQNECLLSMPQFVAAPNDTTGKDAMHPTYGCKGSLKTMNFEGRTYLVLDQPGAASGNAYGGLRTLTIPADSNGATGCKDWYLYGHLCFWANVMGQTGEMTLSVLTADDKLIAGLTWYKTDMSGNSGAYEVTVGGQASSTVNAGHVLRTWTYTTSHLHAENPWFSDWGHVDMKKEGSKITFFYWGGYFTYNVPEIANLVAAKVQVSCKVWAQQPNKRMYCAGWDVIDFYKINVSKWRDVPNRYWQGCKLEIDGDTNTFLVSGMPKPSDEILGTTYFKAPPGETEVKLVTSSFCTPAPTAVARIREAWL